MSFAVQAKFDPMRKLAYTGITDDYAAIGTKFTHEVRCIWINNDTDRELTFSFDGIEDHISLPALGYFFWDITSNRNRDHGYFLPVGGKVYVRTETINPTTGRVTVSVMYGLEN